MHVGGYMDSARNFIQFSEFRAVVQGFVQSQKHKYVDLTLISLHCQFRHTEILEKM